MGRKKKVERPEKPAAIAENKPGQQMSTSKELARLSRKDLETYVQFLEYQTEEFQDRLDEILDIVAPPEDEAASEGKS